MNLKHLRETGFGEIKWICRVQRIGFFMMTMAPVIELSSFMSFTLKHHEDENAVQRSLY